MLHSLLRWMPRSADNEEPASPVTEDVLCWAKPPSLLTAAPLPTPSSGGIWRTYFPFVRKKLAAVCNYGQTDLILIIFHFCCSPRFPPALPQPPPPHFFPSVCMVRSGCVHPVQSSSSLCADCVNPVLYKLLINSWLLSASTLCTEGLLMKGTALLLEAWGRKGAGSQQGRADAMFIRNARLLPRSLFHLFPLTGPVHEDSLVNLLCQLPPLSMFIFCSTSE